MTNLVSVLFWVKSPKCAAKVSWILRVGRFFDVLCPQSFTGLHGSTEANASNQSLELQAGARKTCLERFSRAACRPGAGAKSFRAAAPPLRAKQTEQRNEGPTSSTGSLGRPQPQAAEKEELRPAQAGAMFVKHATRVWRAGWPGGMIVDVPRATTLAEPLAMQKDLGLFLRDTLPTNEHGT